MLWLALHFPLFALESLPLRQSPSAVVERGRILAGDPGALAAGVMAGQKLSTALGLVPGLRVFERDPAREAAALADLACAAGRFTPSVSLAPPDALLLEIGACLRLFGGAPALIDAVLAACGEQGWSVAWAAAPTPLAALWLARSGAARLIMAGDQLPSALASLPCTVPGWPATLVARLESFGMRCLGDLAALPTSGLRRRIGAAAVDDLLRARGEMPDPRRCFVFPERFATTLELPSRVEYAAGLAFAGQRLLAALAGWLHGRQALVRACTLHLHHDDGSNSALPLRLGEASADEARLLRLLREHLGRLTLAAPVESLRLEADEVLARPGASGCLFAEAITGEGRVACLERLRARLGAAAVQVLGLCADHRPECATVAGDPGASASPAIAALAGPRPLWLLPAPQPLAERAGGPCWHGPLHLATRGERLESGWWDSGEENAAGDIRRDYFVARNRQGQWAWIF
ncbi:MAG: DNA polymerase Y family protein, partial [Betaproteobacteria bacterium]|nr:DNA polymerase Y family protein [Betaproteobacteria bacterium]